MGQDPWLPEVLVWLNAASTLYLTGLIWCVQVVHYPLMSAVGGDRFIDYHRRHTLRISWVVVGPMVVELLTAVALVWPGAVPAPRWMTAAGLVLVVIVWLSTFLIQVPLHRRLATGFDARGHRALVWGNWVRTVAWTARGALVIAIASLSP